MKPIMLRVSFLASANHWFLNKSHHLAFSTHYHNRRQEEERRSAPVSVWWDLENCNLPSSINMSRVPEYIRKAVRTNGIHGPIQITAFGDFTQISRTNKEALSYTGIKLSHVLSGGIGGKNSVDRSLIVDLMFWVSENPPPAHIFLISGDGDFAGILHKLRMSNYNILVASTGTAPSVLCSAATIMWQWGCLLKGENLTGRLFNQPPDGPYRFLRSMQHVVKLHPSSKEQYIVKPVYSKPRYTLASTQYEEAPETRSSPKPNGEINSGDDIMKNSKASQCPEPVMKTQLNPQESQKGERQLESSSMYSPGVGAKAHTKN